MTLMASGHKTLVTLLPEVVSLFPVEVRKRGINRAYHEYEHTLRLLDQVVAQLDLGPRVLDVGAGAGVIPLVLARWGADVHVVDTWTEYAPEYDNQMGTADDFLRRFEENGVASQRVDVFEEPLPYPNATFDLVTMFSVIEHLHGSPAGVLEEIKRVLRPKGYLVLSTPNIASLQNRLRLLAGRTIHFPLRDWYYGQPFTGHVREYTLAELYQMMGFLGLRVMHSDLSESPRYNTRLAGDRWLAEFRINSLYQVLKALYFAVVWLWPSLRYSITIIAQKP